MMLNVASPKIIRNKVPSIAISTAVRLLNCESVERILIIQSMIIIINSIIISTFVRY